MEKIGKELRFIRKKEGVSVAEIARYCDVTPVYIYQIETEEKNPSLKVLKKMTGILPVKRMFNKLLKERIGK